MTQIIPDFVIQNWYTQYEEESDLWSQYPEYNNQDSLQERIEADREVLHDICFKNAKDGNTRLVYIASAGPPLAGKSTILGNLLQENPDRYGNVVKIDPDVWGMRYMINTYSDHLMAPEMVANASSYKDAQIRGYDIARPASNFLTLEMLNEAASKQYDIAHGTTLTNPAAAGMLTALKNAGYEIDLVLCNAPDETRAQSQVIRTEQQGFYQATAADIRDKGLAFPERLSDYFTHADNLLIYWREEASKDAVLAASYSDGVKHVHDQDALSCFINKYDEDRQVLAEKNLPDFQNIEQIYIDRFTVDSKPEPSP